MAGLLSAQEAPEDERGGEQDPSLVADDEGTETASPEEQAQYDAFVKLGRSLIGEKGEDVLDLLDEDPTDLQAILGDTAMLEQMSPSVALAATTVIVVLEAINRSPERPADEIIMHGGKELLETLAQLSEDAGIHEYTQEEMNQAWLHGVDLYRESASAEGMVDEDALKSQFDEIVSADKEGRLNEVVPGLADAQVESGQAEEPPQMEDDDGRAA